MRSIIFICVLFVALISNAQDIIKFKSGTIQEVKIVGVTEKNISYRIDINDESGAVYTISLGKVESVQYSNGKIEDFKIFNEETANTEKAHLLEFNMVDLAFQRASIYYELFPTKKRNWSLSVPVRYTLTGGGNNHYYMIAPWFEAGLGGNIYIVRKNKSNLSFGVESNYCFTQWTYWEWDPDFVFQQEFTENAHYLGFYSTANYKYNFKPRFGMNFGFGLGWKYRVLHTQNQAQGKLNIGVFWRF
ncbi:MAG: hypothetical protein R2780_00455 [Crocinitomicaceae bacterium]|nr:hypothetical protein [Crocinitomicaceae bacterium]